MSTPESLRLQPPTLRRLSMLGAALAISAFMLSAIAADLTIPNKFGSGTPAIAADVNANFEAVQSAVNSKQDRVSGECKAGEAIKIVNANGTVVCEPISGGAGGTITGVTAGGGLSGGGKSGDVSLSLTSCANGQVLKSSGAAWVCSADATGSYPLATPTADGLMSAGDKSKIDSFSGWGYIPNAFFEQSFIDWQIIKGQGAVLATAAPFIGTKVFSNAINQTPWISSVRRVPINPHWTYEVRGSFRLVSGGGSTGAVYLAVRLFDAKGTELNGSSAGGTTGTWWFYPVNRDSNFTDNNWHTYSARFGSGSEHQIPASAVYMTVGAILNYDTDTVSGNRIYETTGLTIVNTSRPPIFVQDTRPQCPSPWNGANPTQMSSNFTLDRPAYVTANASIISSGTGRRDTSLVVDGIEMHRSLGSTLGTAEWQNHHTQWVGLLAAGNHTIKLNGSQDPLWGTVSGYGCGPIWGNMVIRFDD